MREITEQGGDFVTGAKAETRLRDFNALRRAIRSRADHEGIERLWDRCERWVFHLDAPSRNP